MILLKIAFFSLLIIVVVIGAVAYLTTAERKIIGYMQCRVGPNRVGFHGVLQPIADGIKFISKELMYPRQSHVYLFILAPILSLYPLCWLGGDLLISGLVKLWWSRIVMQGFLYWP